MGKLIDLTGKRFGRLYVIQRWKNYDYGDGKTSPTWLCRCDCGKLTVVMGHSLRSGNTTSCGCYRREISSDGMKAYHKYKKMERWNVYGLDRM